MDARELLGKYYGLVAEKRFGDAVALFRDEREVVWSIPGRGPMAGKYESKAAIEKTLHRLDGGQFGDVSRPIHSFCLADDGEHVCAQYLLRMTRGGRTCDIVAIDAWHVDGDSLAEVWTFFETLYEFDAWTQAV
jgi:ketosteroid isomerase-like protein